MHDAEPLDDALARRPICGIDRAAARMARCSPRRRRRPPRQFTGGPCWRSGRRARRDPHRRGAADDGGHPVPITVTATDFAGATATDLGSHTFSEAVLYPAGSRTITATDTRTASVTERSAPITVSPASAQRFAAFAPATATAGEAATAVVTVKGAYFNVVTGYRGTSAAIAVVAGAATITANYPDPAGDKAFAWGRNGFGALGDGAFEPRSIPGQVGTDTHWAFVATGSGHTLAIKTNGALWTWGDNEFGQLGDGTSANRSAPLRVGTGTGWTSVAAGLGHTVALTS